MAEVERRSAEEVERLKRSWLDDPIWDIEDTDGFGAHRDELLAYRQEAEEHWEREEERRAEAAEELCRKRAASLGCSVELVRVIEGLERGLRELREATVDRPV